MGKYIDSEKLKAEIERRIELLENGTGNPEVMKRVEGVLKGYNFILSFIDSLQQEQPDNNVEEKAISLQIQAYLTTASDELYAPGKPLYTEAHHKGIHECMLMWQKLHQYYFSTRQEQPDVELEKEIEWEWVHREKQEVDLIECAEMDKEEFARFARHFWNKGYNARKP